MLFYKCIIIINIWIDNIVTIIPYYHNRAYFNCYLYHAKIFHLISVYLYFTWNQITGTDHRISIYVSLELTESAYIIHLFNLYFHTCQILLLRADFWCVIVCTYIYCSVLLEIRNWSMLTNGLICRAPNAVLRERKNAKTQKKKQYKLSFLRSAVARNVVLPGTKIHTATAQLQVRLGWSQ